MVFATSELLIGEEEITDMDGIGLAVIQRPKVTLRRPFTAAREGLSVVGTDGATLLRLERPDGPTIKSLWVENGAGERVGVFTGRSRFALTGGRFEISRDGAVIGTARCGALLDELEAATKDGERVATADRQGEEWFVRLSPGITDDWTRLVVAFVVATEIVRFQRREW